MIFQLLMESNLPRAEKFNRKPMNKTLMTPNTLPSVILLTSIMLIGVSPAQSERLTLGSLPIPDTVGNIYVQKLASDSYSTDFLIVIKSHVPLHKHAHHTETIYVLEGTGEFQEGNKHLVIGPGDYLRIPKGTPHGVRVTSSKPLKVLSVQAPEFFGKDRIAVENP
tara:strand:+ start:2740 stop:3237 length:498 start_codon:yes stop_codon:yes gene_type:complete